MKENMDKLDHLFEKAFTGFEESPPAEVKKSIFRRMLLFNTWRSIRKYVFVLTILLMAGGIAYFSGALLTGKSEQLTNQNSSVVKKENSISIPQKTHTDNSNLPSTLNKKEVSDLRQNNTTEHPSIDKQITAHPGQYQNKSPSIDQDNWNFKTNKNINNPIQYDKTNTSQSITLNSTNNSTLQQKRITDNSNVSTDNSIDPQIKDGDNLTDISVTTVTNTSEDVVTDEPDNYGSTPAENPNINKNRKTPLLWSIGLNVGHSLIQSGIINTSGQTSDENNKVDSKMNFPSGFAGINVRGEKKHLFFDFGLQYSNFSERISTNQLLYNSREYPDIAITGHNTVIDTNGGYWHFTYISTDKIIKYDSVWTWRIDSNLISVYDTTYKQRYDTLKNPSWVNSFYLVELPMNIGWMKNFNKVNLGFSTGPIFSLLVGTKGKMPYYITNQSELVATQQEFQKFRFSISWQISGIIDYQFSKRMLIEFAPYYRRTLLPYKSSVSAATLKNNSLGLQLGLRYYF